MRSAYFFVFILFCFVCLFVSPLAVVVNVFLLYFFFVRVNRDVLTTYLMWYKWRAWFVETDQESLKICTKMAFVWFWKPLVSPWPPLSPPKLWLYLPCTVFIESHNADVKNILIYLFCATSTLNCSFTSQGLGEVGQILSTYLLFSTCFLCIEVVSLGWDVVSQGERMYGSWIVDRLSFLCLEYTFVLSILLLLSVITVFMSSTVIFPPVFNSVLSIHINEMKENHHSENKPQTTWLNV